MWRSLWLVLFVVAFGTNVPTPLLLVYGERLDLSATTLTAAFGVYAAGLLPALLLAGPASDRLGRRVVVVPFVVLSAAASVLFLGAGSAVAVLFLGRFVQGAVSGVVFSVGSAWFGELVEAAGGGTGVAARRTATALASGWALGPLTAGLLAQWLPAPTVLPYLVHLGLMAVGLVALRAVPETLAAPRARGPLLDLGVPAAARVPFAVVVLPIALAVFTLPSTAATVLPLLLAPAMPGVEVAVTGFVAGVTLLTGAFAQPLERRLGTVRAGPVGLALGAVGLGLSLVAERAGSWPLLVPVAVLLGVGYGLCLAAGLTLTGLLASATSRGALTSTFYGCAYLGFAAPLLLALAGRGGGLATPLAVLAALTAVLAAALASPPARRLVAAA